MIVKLIQTADQCTGFRSVRQVGIGAQLSRVERLTGEKENRLKLRKTRIPPDGRWLRRVGPAT
jgi:hypothetical protein